MWLLYTSETFVLIVLPMAVGLLSVLFSLPLPSLCCASLSTSLPLSFALFLFPRNTRDPLWESVPHAHSRANHERLLRRVVSPRVLRSGSPRSRVREPAYPPCYDFRPCHEIRVPDIPYPDSTDRFISHLTDDWEFPLV